MTVFEPGPRACGRSWKLAGIRFRLFRWAVFACLVTSLGARGMGVEGGDSGLQTPTGSAEETYQQARRYFRGDGVTKDAARAYRLMQEAAQAGHPDAIGGLGSFYREGLVVPQNDAEATARYRMGAAKGGVRSQFNYGQMLLHGIGVEKNEAEGLALIRKAAVRGLPEAVFVLGNIYYDGKYGLPVNHAEALALLRVSAEQGNAEAQNTVGVMYENAQGGLARDETRAQEWYRKAAEQNLAKAQANLGRLLGPIGGTRETRVEALMWLLLAEAQGEVVAAATLRETHDGILPAEELEAKKRVTAWQRKLLIREQLGE